MTVIPSSTISDNAIAQFNPAHACIVALMVAPESTKHATLYLALLIVTSALLLLVALLYWNARTKLKGITNPERPDPALQSLADQLNAARDKLKKIQQQLLQSEKMASLGLLAAGIAHEINNPINFVSGGVQALDQTLAELKQKIESNNAPAHEALAEIDQLMSSIRNGVNRTTSIVASLKFYVKNDDQEMTEINVSDCIDTSLTILGTKLRNGINVRKQYQAKAPVMGYYSKLSQVLVNLFDNAIHAVEQTDRTPVIEVTTREVAPDKITIRIRDNGMGIPEDLQARMFEPFFTTKESGTGTGLGLYLSKSIINEHRGTLTFQSQPGVGTEFTITLPTKNP